MLEYDIVRNCIILLLFMRSCKQYPIVYGCLTIVSGGRGSAVGRALVSNADKTDSSRATCLPPNVDIQEIQGVSVSDYVHAVWDVK